MNLEDKDIKSLEKMGYKVIDWKKRYYALRKNINIALTAMLILFIFLLGAILVSEVLEEQRYNDLDEEYRHLVVMMAIKYDLSAVEFAELITHNSNIKNNNIGGR